MACRDHPELSELLCVEMMRRQVDAVGKAAHPQVLTCLPPWMDNLSFAARWEGKHHLCPPLLSWLCTATAACPGCIKLALSTREVICTCHVTAPNMIKHDPEQDYFQYLHIARRHPFC